MQSPRSEARNRSVTRARTADAPRQAMLKWLGLGVGALVLAAGMARAEGDVTKSHGYSYFGNLDYPADFHI